ncbi:IRF3 factor, partial [Chunga burmeisteri]|nr:IRF3 factor [Chunga burmeisteri]
QAWAKVSGRYEGRPEDPAKWKTNFRCAMRSTGMFVLRENHSRCEDDPHKVFAIVPGEPGPMGGLGWGGAVISGCPTYTPLLPDSLCQGEEGDFSSPDSTVDQPLYQQLQVMGQAQQAGEGGVPPAAAQTLHPPRSEVVGGVATCTPYQSNPHPTLTPLRPESRCRRCLSPTSGATPLPGHPPEVTVPVPSPEEAMLFALVASPVPPPPPPPPPEDNTDGIIPILDISIYYRGKLFHQEVVGGSQCLLVYQSSDPAVALRPGHLVRFPSPAELADGKQRCFTEKLLNSAGLQLEQRAHKLFATRLKKCKVFWALSQQLEGVGDPPCNLLYRDQETPIFDFNEFCTELRDFRNGQRRRSPDFTIYLCFGQCFSKAKPKESKLILVKLVPKFCEYWYEQVLREGASSLDSGTVSLQLSDSFSLFELIEQCDMQID